MSPKAVGLLVIGGLFAAACVQTISGGESPRGQSKGGGAREACAPVYVSAPAGPGEKAVVSIVKDCELSPATDAAAKPSLGVSASAQQTRPRHALPGGYPGVESMIENGDMAAFMERVRSDYAADRNRASWGYLVIDAIAADDAQLAAEALARMPSDPRAGQLGAEQLRPWVSALQGRQSDALAEIARLDGVLPVRLYASHRSLLSEGIGDIAGALAIYETETNRFTPPSEETPGTPAFVARFFAFAVQRQLAVRQADLLRAVNRDKEAIALLERLLEADPDNPFLVRRLEQVRKGEDRPVARSLRQALARALADQADLIAEAEARLDPVTSRGGRTSFNHLVSSLMQGALLLDPDNGELRLLTVGDLYSNGRFEAALRLAQLGNPSRMMKARLLVSAGLAALELGSQDALTGLVNASLRLDSSTDSKLAAAGALLSANATEQALRLIEEATRAGLPEADKIVALLSKSQAHFQAGDVKAAVATAREAVALEDNRGSRQFLASMLIQSPDRPEGLTLMRALLAESPDDTGVMNNLGYALIDKHVSEQELEEGFKILKEASRLAPDEPNLLDSLGWAYYYYGDFEEAERFIELAQKNYLPFYNWELEDHMGDVQWRLGNQDAARALWRKALDSRPPAHEAPRLNAKIENGLLSPAPVRRSTPEVPLNRQRGRSAI